MGQKIPHFWLGSLHFSGAWCLEVDESAESADSSGTQLAAVLPAYLFKLPMIFPKYPKIYLNIIQY